MDEATKIKLKEAGLEGVITAFDALKTTADKATADLATATKTIAEKDVIIQQKTDDVVGARKEYKKLADMSKEEKDAMSAKEIELQERQEAHEASVAAFQKSQAEVLAKEVGSRRTAAITRLAGKDPELAKKIEENFARINGSDKAQTEEEVAKFVGEAFNMTGAPKPDPVRNALGGGGNGEAGGDTHGEQFSETAGGKSLAEAMGLPPAPVEGAK